MLEYGWGSVNLKTDIDQWFLWYANFQKNRPDKEGCYKIHANLEMQAHYQKVGEDIFITICGDVCFWGNGVINRIRNEVIDALQIESKKVHISVSATHTHASFWGHVGVALYDASAGGKSEEWVEELVEKSVEVVLQAKDALEECDVEFVRTMWLRRFFHDRLNVQDPLVDQTLDIFVFKDKEWYIHWLEVFWGPHPTCLWNENRVPHGDWITFFRESINAHLGEDVVVSVVPSNAWNMSPYSELVHPKKRKRETEWKRAKEIWRWLAKTVLEEVLYGKERKEIHPSIQQSFSRIDVTWAIWPKIIEGTFDGKWPTHAQLVSKLWTKIAKVRKKTHRPSLLDSEGRVMWSYSLTKLNLLSAALPIVDPLVRKVKYLMKKEWMDCLPQSAEISVKKMWDIYIVMLPGELTVKGKLKILSLFKEEKGIVPEHMVFSSYTNGYIWYLVVPDEYQLNTYEGGHCVDEDIVEKIGEEAASLV